jgi:hypothetical protein
VRYSTPRGWPGDWHRVPVCTDTNSPVSIVQCSARRADMPVCGVGTETPAALAFSLRAAQPGALPAVGNPRHHPHVTADRRRVSLAGRSHGDRADPVTGVLSCAAVQTGADDLNESP